MMKNVLILISCIAVTTNASDGCTYSGEQYHVIGVQGQGKTKYKRSFTYNSGANSVMRTSSYQRNATDSYQTEYAIEYEKDNRLGWRFALIDGLMSSGAIVKDDNGLYGLGLWVKGNWKVKMNQLANRATNPVTMIPGLSESYEGLCNGGGTASKDCSDPKINKYDVLRLDFGGLVEHSMQFTLSDLTEGEIASYRAYLLGDKVNEGTVQGTESGYVTFEIVSSGGFDTVEFFVANDHIEATKFLFQKAGYCAPKSCDASLMDVGKQFGDPHVHSFDGFKWDCQASGHFRTFVGIDKPTDDKVFEIQSIFTRSNTNQQMTVTDSIVINPNTDDPDVPIITIAAKTDPVTFDCSYMIHDSKQGIVPNYYVGNPFGTPAIYLKVFEPRGPYQFDRLEFSYTETHTLVEVTTTQRGDQQCFLNVAICLGSGYWEDENKIVTGLLGGKADGDQSNDWIDKDGQFLEIPDGEELQAASFDFCVENWCIKESEKEDSDFEYSILDGDFEYYDGCGEDFEASCTDIDQHIIVVCNEFETEITGCDGTLEECYIEGCNAGADGIAQFIIDICGLNDMAEGEGIVEEVHEDWLEAGGAKPGEDDDDSNLGAGTHEPTFSPTLAPAPTSGVNGDPHFKTWSGQKYDYHGICDLVLLSHPNFHGGVGLTIHVRSKKTRQWSYISTAVVRIGKETFEVAGMKDGNTHWLNSVQVEDDEWDNKLVQILGFPIKFEQLYTNQRQYAIDLGNDELIELKTWKDMVRVDIIVNHEKSTFDGSLGLMGTYPEGTMLGRDGKTTFTDLNNFGQEWQVLSSESKIFQVVDGPQHPSKCDAPGKAVMRRRLARSDVSREEAEIACAHAAVNREEFDLCVFDVMAIGDKSVAGAY